jgi:hypothetical protein
VAITIYIFSANSAGIFWPILTFLIVIIFILLFKYRALFRNVKCTSGTINLPWSIGAFNFKVSEEEKIIAWKTYVQLKSRKAALPFDEDYDLVEEVYSSLYELFKINRDLLMQLPLDDVRRDNGLAKLQMRVLNEGLRPHLTKWQARFRSWWKKELTNSQNTNLTPQEMQRKFPQYSELIADIKMLNSQLDMYSKELLNIAKSK